MKKINILLAFLLVMGLWSCEEQEVAEVISPDGYPTATYTTTFSGSTATEGDVITYNIKLDKPLDYALTFSAWMEDFDNNILDSHDDVVLSEATIPAYETEATLTIEFVDDNFPEAAEKGKIYVGIHDIGYRYDLNPKTVNPVLDLTVNNLNSTDGLTVAVNWANHDDDWDFFLVDEAITGEYSGYGAATGSIPEILIAAADIPDGTYFVEADPYDVGTSKTDFTVSLGFANQSVSTLEFSYDFAEAANYEGGAFGARMLKIVKSGTTFTVTKN